MNETENAKRAVNDGALLAVVIARSGKATIGGRVSRMVLVDMLQEIIRQMLDIEVYENQLAVELRAKLDCPGSVENLAFGPHKHLE